MDIFRDAQDYENFLKRLRIALGKTQGSPLRIKPFTADYFSLVSFCLMPNHFHMEIFQNHETRVGKLLLKVCTSYSMYFNAKYQHIGHVLQDEFKAVTVRTDRQMVALSAYIHQNPKVGGLVSNLREWPYSSYPDYLDIRKGDLCDKNRLMHHFRDTREYEQFVENRFVDIKEQKEIIELFGN